MNDPAVSILICTRNRCADLRATLQSFDRVEVPRDLPAELIIIDNGSSDATEKVVRDSRIACIPIRYLIEPIAGQARARNRGLAEANGRYILFTDDDVRPPKNWITGMCAPLQAGTCDAVAGGVRIAAHLVRDWMTPRDRSWLASTARIDPDHPTELVGANFAISRDVLKRVSGFDVELGPGALGFGDDTLFAWKLLAAGLRIGSVLQVEVEHHFDPQRLRRASFLDMAKRFGMTQGHLLRKWHKKRLDYPQLSAMRKLVMLSLLRLKHWPSQPREGIPDWEGSLLSEYHALKQYAREPTSVDAPPLGEVSVQWT